MILAAVKEALAERQQHDDAHHDADNAYREEAEEAKRLEAVLRQRVLDDKVGRRTYQG